MAVGRVTKSKDDLFVPKQHTCEFVMVKVTYACMLALYIDVTRIRRELSVAR